MIRAFLEDAKEFVVKADGNFLIGTEDFICRGLGLAPSILKKIYADNFYRVVGRVPRKVSPRRVIRDCRRIKLTMKIMSYIDRKLVPDPTSADHVIRYFRTTGAKQ
ncbi:MAG: hypothetical protein MZW92_33725 [Comamonadaceae bacterium]|nr:hypothetical protein [Comamonadaceae bacterium]